MKTKIPGHILEEDAPPFSTFVARRKFLAGLSVLGAAAVLPDGFLRTQATSATSVLPYRIDTHHHFSAPGFIAAIAARKTNQRPLEQWTPSKSIEDMDKSGVETAIISTTAPSALFDETEEAR